MLYLQNTAERQKARISGRIHRRTAKIVKPTMISIANVKDWICAGRDVSVKYLMTKLSEMGL